MSAAPVRIFLSSGEISSDLHAAQFIHTLRPLLLEQGRGLEVFGIGGDALQKAGMQLWVHQRRLRAMGLTEVLFLLPRFWRILRQVTRRVLDAQPDLILVLDYPGFHFALLRRLQKAGVKAPVVYFIPPKVWVWRSHRVEFLKQAAKKVLCIFPFEKQWFAERGIAVDYIGNPLLDELGAVAALSPEQCRKKLQIPVHDPVFAVLPGSRAAELKQHLEPMLRAVAQRAATRQDGAWVCIPAASVEDAQQIQALAAKWKLPAQARLRVSVGDSAWVMRAAHWGLIKSGTSTLEAAYLGLPHVIVYRVSGVSAWIYRRWIRYRGPIGLPNLILGAHEIPELTLEDVNVGCLVKAAVNLESAAERARQAECFERVRQALRVEGSPSQNAARHLIALLSESSQ